MKYNKEYDYVKTRLVDSLVSLQDGSPFLVEEMCGRSGVVYGQNFSAGRGEKVPLKDLNVDPIKLGYFNFEAGPSYIVRMPMRDDWRQGARPRNTTIIGPAHGNISFRVLAKTAKGEYKSIDACSRGGGAWCREFAMHKGGLFYKGRVCGSYSANSKSVKLNKNFSYLSLDLQDKLNRGWILDER